MTADVLVVFSCEYRCSEGGGMDKRYEFIQDVPEEYNDICPVCEKGRLFLDREATLRSYGTKIDIDHAAEGD